MRPEKKKLVILGGGIGSLVTAWHLTSQPNWKEIYESITVYQTGWRLGGKCASGRGPNGRIEEHGLHIWFGFYDNSFDVIQNAYAMLGRPAGSPLATWPDAFKKHSYLVIAHQFKVNWHPWEFDFPVNDRVPGRGSPIPNLWQYISLTIDFIVSYFCGPMEGGIPPQSETGAPEQALKIVKQTSDKWLMNDSKRWWPKTVDPATGGFDWSSVADIYHRANIDPSERYVLSVSGSTSARLTGHASGFSNLILAGDWTVNGLNVGCVEAATISGKIAGNVLAGNAPLKDVWGYGDL